MRAALALCCVLGAAPVLAAEPFGPFASPGHPVTRDAVATRPVSAPRIDPLATTFFYVSYEFYRQVLSPIDGPQCIHRPTCSRYALIAIQRHPVLGVMLTVDRLWRSINSSALRLLPLSLEGERFAFIDPVEESDFWFRRSR